MSYVVFHYTGFGEVREDGTRSGWGEILTPEEALARGLISEKDIPKDNEGE